MNKFLSEAKDFLKKACSKIKDTAVSLTNKLSEKTGSADGEKKTPAQKALTGVGIALCVIFSILLICNLVIIIKGTVAPEKPPSVLGLTPMVVLSGSMSGDAEDHIEVGDLVFIRKADPDKLKVGDVIAFMDGSTTVTHRIIRVDYDADGSPRWTTKGDANNKEDSRSVTEENLVGIYSFRIPGLGDLAMFLQQPVGMLLVIGLPCLAFIIYDIIRRQRSAAKQDEKTSEMEAELERLRKLVGDKEEASPAEAVEEAADEEPEQTEEPSGDQADTEEVPEETAEENSEEVPEEVPEGSSEEKSETDENSSVPEEHEDSEKIETAENTETTEQSEEPEEAPTAADEKTDTAAVDAE